MFEVEKRSLVTKSKLKLIKKFLETNGKLVKEVKRFNFIKVENKNFISDPNSLIDIKIRTTSGGGKFALKYGNWHKSASREEYEFKFEVEEITQIVNILKILSFKYFITTYVLRSEYKYKNLTITLDNYYSLNSALLEAEIVVKNKNKIKNAELEILTFFKSKELKTLDSSETINFINKLNSIKKFQVDFEKISVENWHKRWKKFIYCLV